MKINIIYIYIYIIKLCYEYIYIYIYIYVYILCIDLCILRQLAPGLPAAVGRLGPGAVPLHGQLGPPQRAPKSSTTTHTSRDVQGPPVRGPLIICLHILYNVLC